MAQVPTAGMGLNGIDIEAAGLLGDGYYTM